MPSELDEERGGDVDKRSEPQRLGEARAAVASRGHWLAPGRGWRMMRVSPGCDAFLQDQLPNGWRAAVAQVEALATRLQYLPWTDRMPLLDDFVWSEARRLLSNEEITAVINRQPYTLATSHAILEYTTMCSAVLTSIFTMLEEGGTAETPEQALAFLLSRSAEHQEVAVDWVQQGGFARLQPVMARLPGFAFLYLAVYPNDSAESFMARDAFWTAMLGY